MKTGWRAKEIDEADGPAFLRPRAWDAARAQIKKKPRHAPLMEPGRGGAGMGRITLLR